jgi:hypothetical protein
MGTVCAIEAPPPRGWVGRRSRRHFAVRRACCIGYMVFTPQPIGRQSRSPFCPGQSSAYPQHRRAQEDPVGIEKVKDGRPLGCSGVGFHRKIWARSPLIQRQEREEAGAGF